MDPMMRKTSTEEGIAVFHPADSPKLHQTAWFPTLREIGRMILGEPVVVHLEGVDVCPKMNVEAVPLGTGRKFAAMANLEDQA